MSSSSFPQIRRNARESDRTLLLAPLISRNGTKKMGVVMQTPNNKEDLGFLQELFEAGQVVPVIDRCYPLSEAAQAFWHLDRGLALGKVVITM